MFLLQLQQRSSEETHTKWMVQKNRIIFCVSFSLYGFVNVEKHSLLCMTGLSHLCKNIGQFFTLLLAADVCTQASFAELQGALIFADLQQFHASFLVWCVSNDLTNQISDEFGVLGLNLREQGETKLMLVQLRQKLQNFLVFSVWCNQCLILNHEQEDQIEAENQSQKNIATASVQ